MLVIERTVHREPESATPKPKSDSAPPHNARPRSSTTAEACRVVSDDVRSGASTVKTSGGTWANAVTLAHAHSVRINPADGKKRTITCPHYGPGLGDSAA